MSHFTVLVVTNTPDEMELKQILQPFHEYEYTGIDDQYVKFVPADETTEELQKQFEEHQQQYSDDPYDYFETYMDDWHGYHQNEDGVWGRKTNPNAKWDGWVVGGRYNNRLYTMQGDCNCALKSDVSFQVSYHNHLQDARIIYDNIKEIVGDLKWKSWKDVREFYDDIQDAREYYHNQEAVKKIREFDVWASPEEFLQTREQYTQKYAQVASQTFAILYDGVWYQRGEMGWWACVSDENNDWNQNYMKLIETIPEDKYLTVVDCHI